MKTIVIVAISVIVSVITVFGVLFAVGVYEQLEFEKAVKEYESELIEYQKQLDEEQRLYEEIQTKEMLFHEYIESCQNTYSDFPEALDCARVRMASAGYSEYSSNDIDDFFANTKIDEIITDKKVDLGNLKTVSHECEIPEHSVVLYEMTNTSRHFADKNANGAYCEYYNESNDAMLYFDDITHWIRNKNP